MTNQRRFQNLKNDKGIRKDLRNGHYVAAKSFQGKRISKSFKKLSDARDWQRHFNKVDHDRSICADMLFLTAWERYLHEHIATLNFSSQERIIGRYKLFKKLHQIKMNLITPNILTDFLLFHKKRYKSKKTTKRCNFDQELKILKAFFNWYRETINYRFINPILKRHKRIGKIRDVEFKNKKMTPEEISLFFQTIKKMDLFWYEVALTQFYFASRIQEIAGLQKSSVDFDSREVLIKDVVIWDSKKHFKELKKLPKNGDVRIVYLNDEIFKIFQRKIAENKEPFLFSLYGRPLEYREIQYNYQKALIKCGLASKFSGTHFMRHSMATITRGVTKSLELTQAITGHKDQRLVQHYAFMNSDNNKQAQIQVETFFENLKNKQHCVQKVYNNGIQQKIPTITII